jgi:hypothetical protein
MEFFTIFIQYDAWTSDGVLEHFWGEHIHHGFYPDGQHTSADFKVLFVRKNFV